MIKKWGKKILSQPFFILLLPVLLSVNFCMAQQAIGANPNIDAGFENQAGGNLPLLSTPPPSTTSWSCAVSGNGQNRFINVTGGYGGPKFVSLGKTLPTSNTISTASSNLVNTNTFIANTKYIIQFHYKQNLDTADNNSYVFISSDTAATGTTNTKFITLATPTIWTKFSAVVTTSAVATQTINGTTGIAVKLSGVADGTNSTVVDVDNFVVYPADNQTTPVADITAPNSPGASTVSNIGTSTLDVNWGAASGGADGGGYLIIRYAANPTGQPDPLANAVYANANAIGTGTVVYRGTATSFSDAGLTPAATYFYRLYTVDKAFNYSTPVTATATTLFSRDYYIDFAGGSDANVGSIAFPWKNVTKVNSFAISPGSRIFLKVGNTWTGQQLKFIGSGTAANAIIVDSYGGAGAKPILAGNGLTGQGVVYLYNQSYIEINNLEVTNSPNGPVNADYFVGLFQNGTNPLGADRRGIMVAIDNYGTANHIYLKNVDVHHVKGQLGSGSTTLNGAIPKRTGGIYFAVLDVLEQAATNSKFNDILIDSCNIYYCENIGLSFDNEWNVYYPGGQGSSNPADVTEYNNWYNRRFSNIKVSNNIIHHIGKNAMIIRCTDETGLVEYNTCYETGLGTTGNTIFTARAKGTVLQYNEGYTNRGATQTIDPGNYDGSLYDADFGSVGIIFQYSYSHDNSHGLYWGCNTRGAANNTSGIPDPGDSACTVRYNISQNDLGDLIFFNYPSAGNKVYNNVFYIGAGLSPNIIHEGSKQHTYQFYNNIIYNLSAAAKYDFAASGQTRTISNNVFYGFHPTGALTGEPADPGKLISDPLFVNPGSASIGLNTTSGYKLQRTSSASNTGVSIWNNGGLDYWKNSLYFGLPDRGAHEYTPITWIGGAGNWNAGANWKGGLPNTNSDILISTGTPALNIDFTVTAFLTINNTGSLIVNAANTLDVAAGGNADFGGRPITLKSGESGSASIGKVSGTLSGATDVTIERYISGKRAWRLLTAPVTPGSLVKISNAWQDGAPRVTNPAIINSTNNPNPGYGTHITFGNPATSGYDQGINGNTSIKYLTSTGWNGVPTATNDGAVLNSGIITDQPGYMLFVRGDRGTLLSQATSAAASPTILRPRGSIRIGQVDLSLSTMYINGASKFRVVGNPYPSSVNFHSMALNASNISAGIADAFYVWDPNITGSNGVGGFVALSYNNVSGVYDRSIAGSNINNTGNIPSGAAFLIDYPGVATTIRINETHKTSSGVTQFFRPAGNSRQSKIAVTLFARNADSSISLNDGVLCILDKHFINVVDETDLKKLGNFSEDFSILKNGSKLSIEKRDILDRYDTIQFNLTRVKIKNYQLAVQMDDVKIPGGCAVYLEDLYKRNKTAINATGNFRYDFSISADSASYVPERLRLVCLPIVIFNSIKADQLNNDVIIEWKVSGAFDVNRYEIERSADGLSFSTTGVQLCQGPIGPYTWKDIKPEPGEYYYRIKCISNSKDEAYSETVKVKITGLTNTYTIFPNPATADNIHFKINSAVPGSYTIRIVNSKGELIDFLTMQHPGGTSQHLLKPLTIFTSGTYLLEIKNPVSVISSEQLMIKIN